VLLLTGMTILLTLSVYQISIYRLLPTKSSTMPYIGTTPLLFLLFDHLPHLRSALEQSVETWKIWKIIDQKLEYFVSVYVTVHRNSRRD